MPAKPRQRVGARAVRAAATRRRVLAAARSLFVERGYASTSMKAIADEAGVAVQTLYFTFASKRAILKEVVDVEVAGDDRPIATLERPWAREALAAPPAELLERMVAAAGTVHMRVAPVIDVVRSAATSDPDIAELWATNVRHRYTVAATMIRALAEKTPLRKGISPARAADITLAILSTETFTLLVKGRGWTLAQWRDWATDALVRQLLPDP